MTAHAKLAPSSANRRAVCPGSRALEERYPREESEESKEGTLAHAIAARYLLGDRVNLACDDTIPREMIHGAALYCDAVETLSKGAQLHVETKIDISVIHSDCSGTADCYFVVDDTLFVIDYKFGHRSVSPQKNWQLIEYAAGILQIIRIPIYKIVLGVIQPRDYSSNPIKLCEYSFEEFVSLMEQARRFEAEAAQDLARCAPSIHCRDCSAKFACAALRDACINLDMQPDNIAYELSNNELGTELKYLNDKAVLLHARIMGLEQQIISKIKKGESVPYYRLSPVFGRTKWIEENAEKIAELGDLFGCNLRKPIDIITPKQAESLGFPKDLLDDLIETPPRGFKLIEDDPSAIFKN